MMRHQAFFETLGTLDTSSPAWNSVLAGLCALRIVDSLATDSHLDTQGQDARIDAAKAAAIGIREGDTSKAILLRIISLLEGNSGLTRELAVELMAYGKALDLEAKWPLAVDVFRTVSEQYSARQEAAVAIESLTALGAAARNIGDWELSDRSYAGAQHLADSVGDIVLSLVAQVGIANSHVAHGNLPSAEAELQDVLAEAGKRGLQQVEALALHTKAYSAITGGNYRAAVHFAYRSLELTTNQTARDRILGDIAAAYAGLGMRKTARDGYSIVAVTSPHQWVRWQATLNLVELAIEDGSESLFDDYAGQIERETLDPRLGCFLLLLKARGFRRFARPGSEELFAAAHELATRHRLYQVAFDVEAERSAEPVSTSCGVTALSLPEVEPGEVERIAEVLLHLREQVVNN